MGQALTAGRREEPLWWARGALILGVLVLVLAHPDSWSGDAIWTGDHVDFYLRVHQYQRELLAGHWPQVLPDAVRGGGHAFPRFYPPVSHFAAAGLNLVVGDVVLATHLVGLLTVVLSGIGMFVLVRAVGGRSLPALLATMAYTMAPYRFVILNVRGAYAEGWTFVWYPLVLLGLWHLIQHGRIARWWPLTIAALLCSHAVVSVWALPAIALVGLMVPEGRSRGTLLAPGLLTGALGVAAAAFYLVPMWYYLPTVRAADAGVMLATAAGVARGNADLPGVVVLVEILLGVGALAYLVRKRRERDPVRRLAAACLLAHVALVGLTIAPEAVWRWVPERLLYLQFARRLSGPAIFLGAAALGFAASKAISRPARYLFGALTAGLALVGNIGGRAGPVAKRVPGERVMPLRRTSYPDRGMTIQGEYLPRGSEPLALASAIQVTKDSLEATPGGWQRGDSVIRARVRLDRAQEVALPLVAYDFYRVSTVGSSLSTGSRAGQLTVRLDPGLHELRITRRVPPVLLVGFGVSFAAIGLLVVGHWSSVIGHRSSVIGRRSIVVGRQSFFRLNDR